MSLINFDCPECGHNLEVDERGAGFIIKCPACANPLQIPDLPRLIADGPRTADGALRHPGVGHQRWTTVHTRDLGRLYRLALIFGVELTRDHILQVHGLVMARGNHRRND